MKITVKGILHWQKYSWQEGEGRYTIEMSDMTSCNSDTTHYAPIKEVSAEFDIPDDFDPRIGIIAGLRDQKEKVLADAHVKAQLIEERIQQLLCLENKT